MSDRPSLLRTAKRLSDDDVERLRARFERSQGRRPRILHSTRRAAAAWRLHVARRWLANQVAIAWLRTRWGWRP